MENNKNRSKFLQVLDEVMRAGVGMLKSFLFVLLIDVAVVTAGLLILKMGWLSVPIAMGIAAVDMLPVLGSGIVFIPWIIYEFYTGDSVTALGLIVLFAVLTVIKIAVQPLVCGKQIGLSPMMSLLSSALGVMVFGGMGIFIGPLLVVAWRSANKK